MIAFIERQPWKLLLGVIAVLTFLIYLRWIFSGFVALDDGLLIVKNPATQMISGWSLKRIFTTYDPELYIPLTYFSWQLTHAVAGLHAWAYHLGNLLLHIGSALFVARIIASLSGSKSIGFLTGLLFAIHPVNVEAVMWASARKDTLSAFFFFVSLYCYVRWRQFGDAPTADANAQRGLMKIIEVKRMGRLYLWTLVTFLLALLSKVSVIALPAILLLIDWSQGRRITWKMFWEKIPFFILSIIFGIVAILGKTRVIEGSDPWTTLLLALKSTAFYLWKLIVPTGLTVIYPQTTPVTLTSTEFIVPAIVTILMIMIIINGLLVSGFGFRDDPETKNQKPKTNQLFVNVTFGFSWYLLTLAPNYLNFIKNGFLFFASDRYPYIGSVGILFIVALIIVHGARQLRSATAEKVWMGATLVIVLAFSGASSIQAGTWRSTKAMYKRVLSLYPTSAMAENNLGNEIAQAGDPEGARPHFERALALMPSMISAHTNLGNYYRERGEFSTALEEYAQAVHFVATKPHPTQEELASYYIYGEALERVGRTAESIQQFEIAVLKGPLYAEAHYNLGLQYQKLHRSDDALAAFSRAVNLEPLFVPALYHLAGVQAETGRIEKAITTLERLIAIDPNYEKAQEHLRNMKGMRVH